jgi:DNA topoisomerase-3
VQQGERVNTQETRLEGSATKPPPRFNEATLLGAMEGAGKLVSDEELREAMADKGLGTPATRAAIIEGLVWEKYIVRHGKELVPTTKAFLLIALLRGIGVKELCLPELTGDWEFKLRQIQRGQLNRPQFMSEIAAMTREIVERTKGYKGEIEIEGAPLQAKCPKCGGGLKETYRNFKCTAKKCDFYVPIFVAGRIFEPEEVEELITKGSVGPLQGFRSRMGRPFAAVLKLSPAPDFKTEFDFGNQPPEGESAEPVDFTGQEPLGACPKCGARVFEHGMNYLCEKSTGSPRSCDFRTGKVILQQPIESAQVVKLLVEKKTDLLDKFISKKNNRAFKAFLVLKDDGKVGFEFEKREPRAGRERKPREPEPKLDFTGQAPLGKCPKCGAQVFEGPEHYVCERRQAEERPCSFRTGKVVCQQPVSREQVGKLLGNGRTDVFTKFISKAGRPFSASLVLQESGKVGFEFANSND